MAAGKPAGCNRLSGSPSKPPKSSRSPVPDRPRRRPRPVRRMQDTDFEGDILEARVGIEPTNKGFADLILSGGSVVSIK